MSVPPAVETPLIDPPGDWHQLSSPGSVSDQGWLQDFDSDRLQQLVGEAVQFNPELQRLRAVHSAGNATAVVAGATRLPVVDAGVEAGRSRRSSSGSHNLSNAVGGQLKISWEADLWHRLSDTAAAAELSAQALQQDVQAAQLSLAANVAKAWFAAVEAKQQRALSHNRVDNLSANLEVLEQGYGAGLFGALDIHLARANLATERGLLASRTQEEGDSVRQLELLLGRYPGGTLIIDDQLPAFTQAIPADIPSSLLERRSDIRALKLRFDAALATLAAAHKDRFPAIRLSADYGIDGANLADLLKGDNLVWTALASLTQPLFDGGKLVALEQQALAEAEQAKARYQGAALASFAEVESALQQEQQLAVKTAALQLSSEESEHAQRLAFEQYRSGLVDYVTVLEAQRRAFSARSSLLASRGQQLQNRINLYLALGGDFGQAPISAKMVVQGTEMPVRHEMTERDTTERDTTELGITGFE